MIRIFDMGGRLFVYLWDIEKGSGEGLYAIACIGFAHEMT